MKEITNDNENLYVEDVTDNKEMDNVIIPGGSNLEDEEDLSSASSSVDSYEKNARHHSRRHIAHMKKMMIL